MNEKHYTTLFLDVGGVILTNGWDRSMRQRGAEFFSLDLKEMESRHALTFDTYEIGKISLDEYLNRVVFYQPRSFTPTQFKDFMFDQSKPFPDMLQLIRDLKYKEDIKIIVISNEGRELMLHRIEKFELKSFVDFFICSSFCQLRKPDEAIYRLALDCAQAVPQQVIYLDDRPLLTELAKQMGMDAIHHTYFENTKNILKDLLESK